MKEKQIKFQRERERKSERAREEIGNREGEIVRGSDLHHEGLRGKSVGKRREGREVEKESLLCA